MRKRRGNRMDNKTFDDFVSRQQRRAEETVPINWEEQRAEFLSYLGLLYSKIESLLEKYVSSGQIQFGYQSIELSEEYIGSYSAKRMNLRIGRQEVGFIPIGTLFLGSKGRVDVIGPAGRAEILLVDRRAAGAMSLVRVTLGIGGKLPVVPRDSDQDIEWEWRIVTRPPERRFIEITQQSIFQLIMEVANG
jgi:hypothetical protein